MSSDEHGDGQDTANGHRMAFSTDTDFKGGRWVNGEFFYEEQRQGRTQTRDQAIYGMFDGDDDSGDGSSGEEFGGRK
eukprot:CAMPEP_0114436434 /NCGR_PEP_ID=MMETSP0103-20121206/13450_1 /TAXON_ID=37642 ORGANISM="Paraphysomonas imperforata, Strain PA2" /NCGR_SAMPLE_ID=MMETSP0103 /ASSEMBLY_ACC=CAM_ASM_000201 /LENGTH=76 /DNA_ID=CAMNT_0001606703 /DNA_START=34 /DNA_END=261 /DNA_ORIENTATION=+